MARRIKRLTVRDLAREAGTETNDAIVMLWDAGFERIAGPTDIISGPRLKAARRALSIPTASELRSLAYWEKRFGMDRADLRSLLGEHGISISPDAKTLPKGAVHLEHEEFCEQHAERYGVPPPVSVSVR